MARYTLAHSYSSNHNGRQFGPWVAGDEIELDDTDAEWVLRDSPGALAPVTEKRAATKRAGRGAADQ